MSVTYPLKIAVKHRLAETLEMQRSNIAVLLDHPERDAVNFHLALAGVLRSMLCDAEWPTLLILANELAVTLRVWGPYPPSTKNTAPPSFSFNALIASTEPVYSGFEMSAEEYLDAPIGSISLPADGFQKTQVSWYTPRELIKWAANKTGASHFDPKLPTKFQQIGSSLISGGSVTMIDPSSSTPITENDNLPLRMSLIQIAQWANTASIEVLTKYEQVGI